MTICHYEPQTQLINTLNKKKVYGYQNMQLFLPLLSVRQILIIQTFNANTCLSGTVGLSTREK